MTEKKPTIHISSPDLIEGKPLHEEVKEKLDHDKTKLVRKYNSDNISKLTCNLWRLFLKGSLDKFL